MSKKTEAEVIYRQGDVLVRRVDSIPADVKEIPREDGSIVLAHGEVTGHRHAIAADTARFVVNEQTAQRFLDVEKRVALRHEEHGEIRLPVGKYEITIQREYRPADIRNVAD